MRTKEEIEQQIALHEEEVAILKEELKKQIEVGDLVCVQPTREWREILGYSYVAIIRIDHVDHDEISGEKIEIEEDLDLTGSNNYGSYTFDKNVFIKITI